MASREAMRRGLCSVSTTMEKLPVLPCLAWLVTETNGPVHRSSNSQESLAKQIVGGDYVHPSDIAFLS
jgi:hypothetical protein